MAKVLVQSAHQHHPNATVYLCLVDKRLPDLDFYPRNCSVIAATDLNIQEFPQFAFRYDVMELNTAVKPFMLLHLLNLGHDAVLYFDPDIKVFAALDSIVQRLADGSSFLLTPHLLQPAEGDSDPDDVGIMRAGIYNLGFLGVSATAEAFTVLEWWARRLRYQCVSEQARGLFVDQKFVDLVPGFADGVYILRDSRYNVAYWNLAQRHLVQDGNSWRVDGKPLGFFHFSGFDLADESRLSKHSNAFRGRAIPSSLRALMRHYAALVMANGYYEAIRIPYAYGTFASGAPIPPHVRHVFRERYKAWAGDPFGNFEDHVQSLDVSPPSLMSAEELAQRLDAIYASSSWRLTQPLRVLTRLLRGTRGAAGTTQRGARRSIRS